MGWQRFPHALLRRLNHSSLPAVHRRCIAGLDGPVEILRDRWGVPHIYAANLHDLLFGQGYVHAQDRLWQLELNRRIGGGRLAEILGRDALPTDRLLRTVGFARAASVDLAALDETTRLALDVYAQGVNAGMAEQMQRLPLEFRLLRHQPEPWQPMDTLAWGKVMAWALSINWGSEVLRAVLVAQLGPERAAQLETGYPEGQPLILPTHAPAALLDNLLAQFRAAQGWLGIPRLAGMSNNWVVDGTRSATGMPLLANDPHLTTLIPSVWYENHLHSPELQAAGVSMPGAPGIVLGHNARLAWGATAAFPDTQDLYLERFHPEDPGLYEHRDAWEVAQVLQEPVSIRGEPAPELLQVTVTRHGPVIDRLASWGENRGLRLALRWTGYEASRLPAAVLAVNRAPDWDAFSEALADWDAPALNFVYADRDGNIGYYLAGRVPRRQNGLGLVPVPGWTGDSEWLGWIPHAELPHALNPDRHYFVTANNEVVGAGYPYFLSTETSNGYRAGRIVAILKSKEKVSVEDCARIQLDLSCAAAAGKFCRLLVSLSTQLVAHPALHPLCARAWQALRYIEAWDCVLSARSVAGALYEVTHYFAMRRIFEPWLGPLTEHYLGAGFDEALSPVLFGYLDRTPLVAERVLLEDDGSWLVDAQGQPIGQVGVLALALADALAYLTRALGSRMERWHWGRLHQVRFHHALGTVRPLARFFNRGPYPYGGDGSTVWQGGYAPRLPIDPDSAITASWRQVLDVSDWDASVGILPPGQSGRPGSRHYDDMVRPWLEGKNHPLLWTRERIEVALESRLNLEPPDRSQLQEPTLRTVPPSRHRQRLKSRPAPRL